MPGTTATPAITPAPFVLDTSGIDADAKSAMAIEPTATDPEATLAGGPHLVILVGADGKLMADLDGEQESITQRRAEAGRGARAGRRDSRSPERRPG